MRWVALIALITMVSAASEAASYRQIMRQFEAIAFSDEGETYSDRFERWEGPPVKIRVRGQAPSDLLLAVISQLSTLSGISIEVREPANVIIEYVPQGCSIHASGYRGRIRISTRNPLSTVHCTYEELAQLIGPANDACHYRPSIFCDSDFPEAYTDADKIILRTTFDPRLRKGMTREEGMPIARQIIRELYEEQYGPIRDEDGERNSQTDSESTDALSLP
ncbi:MAG: DUF2927 domain-containing protein [Alphaproteobacteria bacterium]